MRNTEHIPSTKISVQILSTRYYGNLDDNIRYHVNAGYMKTYLQEMHSWSKSVWKTVDIQSFGKFVKTISLQHRPAHLKFVHDQLPLGDRKFQRAAIKDPQLKLCPCCKSDDEDPRHFLHCHANSARSDAVTALLKNILGDSHPSRSALAACFEQYLSAPDQPVRVDLLQFPPHMLPTLRNAITEQTQIRWKEALQGFLSRQWLTLASMEMNKIKIKIELIIGLSPCTSREAGTVYPSPAAYRGIYLVL